MSTFKYFHLDRELTHTRPLQDKQFRQRFGYVLRGKAYDGYSKWVGFEKGATHDISMLPVHRVIEFKSNPSLHKCDARCRNARGHSCECSCGGQYHGYGNK